MSNKLELYKHKLAADSGKIDFHEGNVELGVKIGFDAAIALNLPVKFSHWRDKYTIKSGISDLYICTSITTKDYYFRSTRELYEYWLENVYKPE